MSRSLLTWRTVSSTALSISASVVKRPMPNLQDYGVLGQAQRGWGCHSASRHVAPGAAINQPLRKGRPIGGSALQNTTVGSKDKGTMNEIGAGVT